MIYGEPLILDSAGLPSVTSSDDGKVLTVVNGAWTAAGVEEEKTKYTITIDSDTVEDYTLEVPFDANNEFPYDYIELVTPSRTYEMSVLSAASGLGYTAYGVVARVTDLWTSYAFITRLTKECTLNVGRVQWVQDTTAKTLTLQFPRYGLHVIANKFPSINGRIAKPKGLIMRAETANASGAVYPDYNFSAESMTTVVSSPASYAPPMAVEIIEPSYGVNRWIPLDKNFSFSYDGLFYWQAIGGDAVEPYILDLTGTQIEMSMPSLSDPSRGYEWTVDTAIPSEMLAAAEAGRALLVKVEDTNADQSTFQVLPITIGNDPSAAVYVGGSPYSNLEFATLQMGLIFRSNISFVVSQGTTTLTLVIGMVYGKVDFWTGTQTEYDALTTYDSGTTYYIVEASS